MSEEKKSNKFTNPETWVDNYGDYLYNYAWMRVTSKETAEDLIQDTFIAALKAQKNFQGKSSELTWLLSILKRKIVDYYRKKYNQKEFTESTFIKPFQNKEGIEGHWILERAPKEWDTESSNPMQQEEFQQILAYCLSLLPDKWRSLFILKVMEEMNNDEICKQMNCSTANLWVIMHRAKLRLRECIENKWL